MLAAGGSQRMGRPKQLLPWRGRSLVAHAVAEALACAAARVYAVVGANADATGREIAELLEARQVVDNARWAEGLGSSIGAGVRAALSDAGEAPWDGVLLTLADQVLVTREALDALIARFAEAPLADRAIVASAYRGTLGPPAVFGRSHFDALCALEGDAGAKPLFAASGEALIEVPLERAAFDVDTPEDYEALLARPAPGC